MGSDSLWMFDFFGSVMPVFLVAVLGIVLLSAGKNILQWNRNNHQPLLTVYSVIVSKRSEVKHTAPAEDGSGSRPRTLYFITFEVESGDRMEFAVSGDEFGMCAEGDEGRLSFQGTRYLKFERHHKIRRQALRG
ncbi:DUF2500 domain-containing protein [Paenibacillus sp. F411]|uniref:DUF2500 domain-containing protein n=1 Tax=Paenibacillus sp. F411 TaxID=2820239 RepID=UPI001AAE3B6F|nr:DUF2500 domain-containing protein [Paenibacillus sp. F411]MBO2942965.1 DUF2500 domain-containing protein [Paenibacillus sp. F411]